MVVRAVLHAVAPEPEQGPFRQKRAQLLVVKGALEERRMGHGLKCAPRQATVVHVAQLLEQELGLGRLVPRGSALVRSRVQRAVEQVERELPAHRRKVDGLTLALGPIELRAQRMQQHVDLVEQRDGSTKLA